MKILNFSGWLRVLLIIIPYLIAIIVFQNIGSMFIGEDAIAHESAQKSYQAFILKAFEAFATFFILWLFMKHVDKEAFIKLGFHTKGRLKEFILGLFIGGLAITLGYFALIALYEITFLRLNFNASKLLFICATYLLVSITEEAIFRGYLLRNLMNSFNRYLALFLSSLIFTGLHMLSPNASLISSSIIFLAGIMLGLSYIYTKNLWFPIGLHLGWNLFQSLYGFKVSGQNTYSLIEFQINQPSILNGGDFGFEASLLAIPALILIIAFTWFKFHQTPHDVSISN